MNQFYGKSGLVGAYVCWSGKCGHWSGRDLDFEELNLNSLYINRKEIITARTGRR